MATIIDNTTLENAQLVVNNILNPNRIMYSYYPGEPDNICHAIQKIRQILMIENIFKPMWPEIPMGGYDVGLTDEELAIDFQKPLTITEVQEIETNHDERQPTWRPAAYSIPQEGFGTVYTDKLGEFQTVCKSMDNLSNFIRQKAIANANTITEGINGLKRGALKMGIKAILKIYKHAPQFNSATDYFAIPTREIAETNKAIYGIVDLTYVKNSDGTKVGVIFKDIVKNTYQDYEAAEAAGCIKTLKMIKELAKPGTGNTTAQKQESTDNFLKEMQLYESNLSLDLDGYTLNGNVSAYTGRDLRMLMYTDVKTEIGINAKASAFNVLYLESWLLKERTRYLAMEEKIFSDAEIAEDEAEGGEGLGLGRVYGFLMDTNPARPYISLYRNNLLSDNINYPYPAKRLIYHSFRFYSQIALSPNKFACIFMQPKEE